MSPEEWTAVINTNLNSMFNVTRCAIEKMRLKKFGRIISISSINGLKGQIGQSNYSAAKAGIIGFSKAVALENANKGITVNVVAPGYIGTEMVKKIDPEILKGIVSQIPVGRLGEPHEVASLVSYLAGDQASFITGATFSINGGQYLQ
jgi:acetoacetyl-CoA reductase